MIDDINKKRKRAGIRQFILCAIIAIAGLAGFIFVLSHGVDIAEEGRTIMYICIAVFVIWTVLGIFRLVISHKDATKKLCKICGKFRDPAATMARLEQTWRHGIDFKYGRMDMDFIITQSGTSVNVYSITDVVWLYGIRSSINFIPLNSTVYLQHNTGKREKFTFSGFRSKYLDMIQTYVYENCPNIYVGNDHQISKLYKAKDWQEILRFAQMQRSK